MDKLMVRRYPNGAVAKYGLRHYDAGYLNRTEQITIEEFRASEPCRFHTRPKEQPVIEEFTDIAGGMVLQGATNRSHDVHGLVRPLAACWNENDIRTMGGPDRLLQIFDVILMVDISGKDYVRLAHYNGGKQTGASVADFHIHHLVNPDPESCFNMTIEDAMVQEFRNSDLVVAEVGNIKVVAESIIRVGQSHIVQTDDSPLNAENLVAALCQTITLFGQTFANTAAGKEGLPPDYQLMLEFRNGKLHFGTFNPFLAGLGVEMLSGVRLGPSPHQWTPEETIRLLHAKS